MEELKFVENLTWLSDQLLKWKREEKRLLDVEIQRQKDAECEEDRIDLWKCYMLDRSNVRERVRMLKNYIRKLVNSGRLENRDWVHIESRLRTSEFCPKSNVD